MAVEKLRRYELVYLVHPEAEETQITRMGERIGQVVTDFEAFVLKQEDWGKRKLSYEIEKVNKVYYRYMEFVTPL
jgi:small subunit ribosomal protein S6